MKTNMVKPRSDRQAFTLVELIVVLTILVGLAGVLIPAVANMIGRTNRSTTSANIAGIADAIQRYEAQFMSYPNNFDGLMRDLTGTDLNTLNSGLLAVTEDVELDPDTLAALTNAGITRVGIHALDDATFDLPTSTAIADETNLKGLTAAAQLALGLETTGVSGKYLALGVGALCDLNGKTMVDAPVHFPRDAATSPDQVYSRFLAIFQITDGTDALTRAKFVGVIAPDGTGLGTQLDQFYQVAVNN